LKNLCSLAERIAGLQQEVKPEETKPQTDTDTWNSESEAESAYVIPPQQKEIEDLFFKTVVSAKQGFLISSNPTGLSQLVGSKLAQIFEAQPLPALLTTAMATAVANPLLDGMGMAMGLTKASPDKPETEL
jgi:hypothetical protein